MHTHRIEPKKLHARINMAAHGSTQIFSRIARLGRALHKAARRNLLKWREDFLLLSGIKIRCLTTWLRPNSARGAIYSRSPAVQWRKSRDFSSLKGAKWAAMHPALPDPLGPACFFLGRLRSVAQPGSAPASGAGGRRFESCHSDQSSRPERHNKKAPARRQPFPFQRSPMLSAGKAGGTS